jgi:hypothetical protein
MFRVSCPPMDTDEYAEFYLSLSTLEQSYWQRLQTLFQLVQPQKPEKGIKTLILRAREQAASQNSTLEIALEQIFEGAAQRTQNRVKLLQQCSLPRQD